MTAREREPVVPVVLFVYARTDVLVRALDGLRLNRPPLLMIYSDGPKRAEDEPRVAAVRKLIRTIDWCETRVVERDRNLGLGVSLRTGVSEVLSEYERVIVFEDDLVCIPGTYPYLCDALAHFSDEPRVMSVSAWNHPRVQPATENGQGYYDGRFACWGWGTWRRAWQGMDESAVSLLRECRLQRKSVARYGSDLAPMARNESVRNTWAVRFALLHILRGGQCFHPPYSLVTNLGFGSEASNTQNTVWHDAGLAAPQAPLFIAPSGPVAETEGVAELWRKAIGEPERRTLLMRIRAAKWRLQVQLRTVLKRFHRERARS